MADKKDKVEEVENGSSDSDNTGGGDDAGTGGGELGADLGPTGDGNGTLVGGSGGSSGDGGDGSGVSGDLFGEGEPGGGDSLGDQGGLGTVQSGDPGDGPKRGPGRPRGSGKRSGRSRATGTGSNSGGGDGSKQRADGYFSGLGSDAPREVKPEELGEDKEDFAKFSKGEKQKFAADVLTAAFDMVASVTGSPHWKLASREASDLAKAILDVIETFPAKQSKKLEKYLKEYAPYISLLMVGFTIVYPRALYTYGANGNNSGRASNPGDFAASGSGSSGEVPNRKGTGMGSQPSGYDGSDVVQTYFGQYFQ